MNLPIFELSNCLKSDRVISIENPNIRIGVNGNKQNNEKNPFYFQKIKINDENNSYALKSFTETSDTLSFDFENNIKLHLMRKCDNNSNCDIIFNLLYPEKKLNVTKKMDEFLVDRFKNVSFASPELDRIEPFLLKK